MPLVFLIPDGARDRKRAAAALAEKSEARAIEAEVSRIESEQPTAAPTLPLEPVSTASATVASTARTPER